MFSIVDQTVNEALRKGTRSADIADMICALQKYPLDAIDVSLQRWADMKLDLDHNVLRTLLRCKVRPSSKDIAEAGQKGFKRIIVTWSHQPEDSSIAELASALAKAKEFAREICLSIENASHYTADDLNQYQTMIVRYGVDRFMYHDQDSILEPFRTYHDFHALQQVIPCPMEFHGHNNLGLATANSLAALRAGIKYVGAAIGGVGLPGHAAMEEIVMVVTHLWKQDRASIGFSLAVDCGRILSSMGIEVPRDKAIIGSSAFDHESGIHVDGVGKNPSLYEAYQPEAVGLARKTIIGKHSGTTALKQKFSQWNITLSQTEAVQMLEHVREIATTQKGAVTDGQLRNLYGVHSILQAKTSCVGNRG
jgi:homocitrate synthase NifV